MNKETKYYRPKYIDSCVNYAFTAQYMQCKG